MVSIGDFVKVTYSGRNVPKRDKEGNILSVETDSTSPYTLMWDSRPYVCEPGKDTIVPFEAAMVALGDPRSAGSVQSVKDPVSGNVYWVVDRETEVRRLQTLYDNQFTSAGQIDYAPKMAVTDLEGNPVQMVLDDPTGDSVLQASSTILDREGLIAEIQRQRSMIQTLAASQGIDLDNPNLVAQEPEKDADGIPVPPPPETPPTNPNDVPEDK
jgi:hypothetical protein